MTLARLMVVVVGLMLLTGCTRVLDISGDDWERANTSIQQETFDEVECARLTEPAGKIADTIVGGIVDTFMVPLADTRRAAAQGRCMRERGYTPVARR